MARHEGELELDPATWHRSQAEELRRQAELLGSAGYRNEAARQLLEARLHELKAAAISRPSWAA